MDLPLYDVSLFWSLSDRSRVEYMYKFKSLYIQANRPKGNPDPVSSSRLCLILVRPSRSSTVCLADRSGRQIRHATAGEGSGEVPDRGTGVGLREREREVAERGPPTPRHRGARAGLDGEGTPPKVEARRGEGAFGTGPDLPAKRRREARGAVLRLACFVFPSWWTPWRHQ